MENRKTRRAKKSGFRKELKKAKFDEFQDMTGEALNHQGLLKVGLGTLVGFHKNSIYSVQIYQRSNSMILGIRRHDEKPSCPWSHKQKIKNIFFGFETSAIEVFPKESELINAAQIYWIWTSGEIDRIVDELGGIKRERFRA